MCDWRLAKKPIQETIPRENSNLEKGSFQRGKKKLRFIYIIIFIYYIFYIIIVDFHREETEGNVRTSILTQRFKLSSFKKNCITSLCPSRHPRETILHQPILLIFSITTVRDGNLNGGKKDKKINENWEREECNIIYIYLFFEFVYFPLSGQRFDRIESR